MKRFLKVLVLILAMSTVLAACSKTSVTDIHADAPSPEPSAYKPSYAGLEPSENLGSPVALPAALTADTSFIKAPWIKQDLAGNENCLFLYLNGKLPDAVIMMTATPLETSGDALKSLRLNIKGYTDTLGQTGAEMTEPLYSQTADCPSAEFDVTVNLNGSTFVSKTLLVATNNRLYCLQLQCPGQSVEEYAGLFEQIAKSIKAA